MSGQERKEKGETPWTDITAEEALCQAAKSISWMKVFRSALRDPRPETEAHQAWPANSIPLGAWDI